MKSIGLNYAVSAGTITLLSLMNSKWETIKLSGSRIASFLITVLAGWLLFTHISSMWIAYGILLTFIVFMAELLEWRATISVNGVIAAHLVAYEKFNDTAVWNELGIVLVGVGFAIVFNLFNGNYEHKRHIFMDIEDFLLYKKHFIDYLDKTQKSTTGKQVRRRKAL